MYQPDPNLEDGSNACELSSEGRHRDVANAVHLRSIALSLKRIADGLEHSASGGIPNILDAMLDALSEIAAALHPEERK